MSNPTAADLHSFAEAVRSACIEAAFAGYENAAISGLCREGAWETAISAMRMVDTGKLVAAAGNNDSES